MTAFLATNTVRALHVTNWYPNVDNPHEATFIQEYVDALSAHGRHDVVHVQVRSNSERFRFRIGRRSKRERYVLADVPWAESRLVEWVTVLLLLIARLWVGWRWWDVVQAHIAYPLLSHRRIFRLLFGRQLVLCEHWTAYRFGFHLPAKSRARDRMRGMFHPSFPIIVVSDALAADIRAFCADSRLNIIRIPNVVRPDIFHCVDSGRSRDPVTFLMVAHWGRVKLPFLVLEAFVVLLAKHPHISLRIVGHGHQSEEMKAFVVAREISAQVTFLGALSKPEIATEMRRSSALLHPSRYETFSVVCAEALCCGIPVIASNVGAVSEVVGSDGTLVDNTSAAWLKAIDDFIQDPPVVNPSSISSRALLRFSPEAVSASALAVLAQASID
jgi:L-malate glycosyltransferase